MCGREQRGDRDGVERAGIRGLHIHLKAHRDTEGTLRAESGDLIGSRDTQGSTASGRGRGSKGWCAGRDGGGQRARPESGKQQVDGS